MILDAYRSPWRTEELDDLRDLARTFLEREAVPHRERWEEQHAVDRDLWRRAGAAGLLCLSVPQEHGGGGGTFAHEAVLLEERARAGVDAWFTASSPATSWRTAPTSSGAAGCPGWRPVSSSERSR